MVADNFLRDRQAEPRALACALRRKEGLKDVRKVFRSNSCSIIFDGDRDLVGFFAADVDGWALAHRLHPNRDQTLP